MPRDLDELVEVLERDLGKYESALVDAHCRHLDRAREIQERSLASLYRRHLDDN